MERELGKYLTHTQRHMHEKLSKRFGRVLSSLVVKTAHCKITNSSLVFMHHMSVCFSVNIKHTIKLLKVDHGKSRNVVKH